jgi:cbb3-type cytochrome oxidase subunit 3
MNPVTREAAQFVEHAWIMGAMTVLFIMCFTGWGWWAFARRNRHRFEEAALLPLTTGDET